MPWPRTSPSHSPHNEDLAQRLEAKLSAGEQNRYFLLAGFCFLLTINCVVSRNLFVPLLLVLGLIYRQNKVKVEGWARAELLAQEQM
jgi:hypothetical protein